MIHDVRIPGAIGVRLVDPPPEALATVRREVGPISAARLEEPDVVLRFVDSLPPAGDLIAVGQRQAAYDDRSFFVVDAFGRRARIPLDALGSPVEITLERGFAGIPLLRETIDLRLLATDRVLLHSAVVTFRDRTLLIAGWQKGGKSEVLLSLMAAGATFVSDEWTVVDPASRSVAGVGDRLFVWDWHLDQLPRYRARIPPGDRLRFSALRAYRRLYRLAGSPAGSRFPFALMRRAATPGAVPLLGQVHARPERLFGSARAAESHLDTLLLAAGGSGLSRIQPIPPEEVADRMVASQAYERRHLREAYEAFRYAFPDRRNELLESAEERERRLLRAAFAGLPAHELIHPYPVDLAEIRSLVVPAVFDSGRATSG